MKIKYLVLVVALFSPSAFADVDYYTFGGFESVVNAFLRLSAIFSNPQYEWYIIAFAVAGVTVGYLIALGKGFLSGGLKGYDALVSLFLVLFGVTLYTVVIRPTTTVHIYDESTNQYQSVGNIPSLIANAVNLPNIVERGMTQIVDSSTVYTRSEHANGATLELLLNALNGNPLAHDAYLNRSLYSFVDTCMPPALNSNLYTFDLNALMSSTGNLLGELAKLKSLSVPVLYYDAANKGGVEVSCTTAYNSLATILALPSTYNDYRNALCDKSGFDSSNAVQITMCRDRLQDMTNLVFGTGTIGSDTELFMSQAIAKTTYETLSTYAGTAISDIANYREMSQGYGNVIVAEGWIPTIRSSTLVIILSILPILVLFLVTPMIFKSLHLIITLFIFVGLWGVSDAIVHSIIVDQVGDLMASLKNYNGSVTSFMMAPTDINKGLATFGKLQSMAVILAGFISAVFFKLSARAFSQMGERLADNVESLGSNTGQEILDPTRRMSLAESNITAYEKHNMQRQMGTDQYGDATRSHNTGSVRTEAKWLDSMSNNNFDYKQAVDTRSDIYGNSEAGKVQSHVNAAKASRSSVGEYSRGISQTSTDQSLASTEIDQKNIQDVAKTENQSTHDATRTVMGIEKSGTTGALRASTDTEDHIKTAETNTAMKQAESRVDRKNLDTIQAKNQGTEDQTFDAYAQTKMSNITGMVSASTDPEKHEDAAMVSSVQHMQDKLSYKEFTESMGIDLENRTFNESKIKHAMAYGEHQATMNQLEALGFTPEKLGERNKQTELEQTEATAHSKDVLVEEGLADSTQEAANIIDGGQYIQFASEYKAKEAMAQQTGEGLVPTYLRAAGRFEATFSGDESNQLLKASQIPVDQREAAKPFMQQIGSIASGETKELSIPGSPSAMATLAAMGVISGHDNMMSNPQQWRQNMENDPRVSIDPETGNYVVAMDQDLAQTLVNADNEDLMQFVDQHREELEAGVANGGVTIDGNLADINSDNPSIANSSARAGNSVDENNSHSIKNGLNTDMQTVVDGITEVPADEASRMLDELVASDSRQKEAAHLLAQMTMTHLTQHESDTMSTQTGAEAVVYAGVGKDSLADSAGKVVDDAVPLKEGGDVKPQNENAGKKDSLVSKVLKLAPIDMGIKGNLSAEINSTDTHNSDASTNIVETVMYEALEHYQNSQRTERDIQELQEFLSHVIGQDRVISQDALQEYQNDEVDNAIGTANEQEKNVAEEALDFVIEKTNDIVR